MPKRINPEDRPTGLGQRIEQRRENLGMSQLELARRSGYKSVSGLAKLISGEARNPRPQNLKGVADALGVTPEWLLHGDILNEDIAAQLSRQINQIDTDLREFVRQQVAQQTTELRAMLDKHDDSSARSE